MERSGIADCLANKNILLTGSTGFLGKIFVEKVLRVQPHVRKLFLIVKADDAKSAEQRLHDEVFGKDLFRVLKEEHGSDFSSFIAHKVTPVVGDVSCINLGVKESELLNLLWNEINIIVNLAATTKFDERYDAAVSINTLGAKHTLKFAKKCAKLEILLHVSTAYVCGEGSGLIQEKPFKMGETLNEGPGGLDIERELKLVQTKKIELRTHQVKKKEERLAMKEFGLQRARFYGWPNTYVFTKSMGEMLLGQSREHVPLCIMRPTIITSTYKEPFPGWVEGVRTIDSIGVAFGKGKLNCFLADDDLVLDIIPGDMVVNAMIAAIYRHANQPNEFIYHVGSSTRNPIISTTLADLAYRYFSQNPWIEKSGKPVIVSKPTQLTSAASFLRFIALHYQLPLKGLQVVNAVFCNYFRLSYMEADRKINYVLRCFELYKPYVFFEGVFDGTNLESLQATVEDSAQQTYYFDPKIIDWEDYFMDIHIPGLVRYCFN